MESGLMKEIRKEGKGGNKRDRTSHTAHTDMMLM